MPLAGLTFATLPTSTYYTVTHSKISAQINPSNISAQINPSNMVLQDSAVSIASVNSSNMVLQDSAVSMAPVQAILELQKAAKPQRLQQILASLHYLLTFNTEAQDYQFTVDPIDRPILTGRRITQFEKLINQITNGAVRVYYTPKTGIMTINTISESLYHNLSHEVYGLIQKSIAGMPGFELMPVYDPDMPQHICRIEYNNKPYGLFLLGNSGNAITSILPDITRNHPSIKMVVHFEFCGLDNKIRKGNRVDARVHRIAGESCVQVWVHQNGKFIKDKASSSNNLHEGGELRLRLPLSDENAQDNTVSILKFSEILNIVRKHCEKGVPLTGHPNNNNKALQASVFPLDIFKSGFAAHTAQLLGLRAVEQQKALNVVRKHCEEAVPLTGHPNNNNKALQASPDNKTLQASMFPLDIFKFGFAARTTQLLGLRAVEWKARFSSLSGGALATRSMSTGLGQIKAVANGRRMPTGLGQSVLSARRLLGRLLRR